MAYSDEAAKLAELIEAAQPAVALTGAGISVPSGIPDFRSPGTGLWERVNPFEVAHIDAFRRDPRRFWQFYSQRFATLRDKKPNGAHYALAELERRGLLAGVITQNIDRLHSQAGSKEVVEVHGSIARCRCLACGLTVPLEEAIALIEGDPEGVPRCHRCNAPLKPDVVLFGELLPLAAFARAEALCEQAALCLCVGTSLEVHPVAGLPELTVAKGGKVAILTKGKTPLDDLATLKVEGDVEEVLKGVVAALGSRAASAD
jgi:NAD-dependent deacetylase